jgi:hypothetical protein
MAMSLLAAALVAAGTTMRAAPDQTARPGDMTEARLWIQNRTRADAIAVNLRAADIETPLRVQVANTDSNPHSVKVTGSIRTQPLRQEWDYDTVVIVPDTNPTQALKPLGLAGWETTGVSWTNAQGAITLLLKRPR